MVGGQYIDVCSLEGHHTWPTLLIACGRDLEKDRRFHLAKQQECSEHAHYFFKIAGEGGGVIPSLYSPSLRLKEMLLRWFMSIRIQWGLLVGIKAYLWH